MYNNQRQNNPNEISAVLRTVIVKGKKRMELGYKNLNGEWVSTLFGETPTYDKNQKPYYKTVIDLNKAPYQKSGNNNGGNYNGGNFNPQYQARPQGPANSPDYVPAPQDFKQPGENPTSAIDTSDDFFDSPKDTGEDDLPF